jgi:hypothetical protein
MACWADEDAALWEELFGPDDETPGLPETPCPDEDAALFHELFGSGDIFGSGDDEEDTPQLAETPQLQRGTPQFEAAETPWIGDDLEEDYDGDSQDSEDERRDWPPPPPPPPLLQSVAYGSVPIPLPDGVLPTYTPEVIPMMRRFTDDGCKRRKIF